MLVLFSLGFILLIFDFILMPLSELYPSGAESHLLEPARIPKPARTPRLSFFLNQPMPINTASRDDLSLLPGISDTLAGRIVEFRERKGRITNAAELEQIQGIGKKISHNIAVFVSFAEP